MQRKETSHTLGGRFPFATFSPAFIKFRLFDDGPSDQSEVILHCCFDLHLEKKQIKRSIPDLCIQFKHLVLRYFRLSEELQKQYKESLYTLFSQEFIKVKNRVTVAQSSKICGQQFSSVSAPTCFQYCLAVKVGTNVITKSSPPFFVCFCLFFPDYKRYFELCRLFDKYKIGKKLPPSDSASNNIFLFFQCVFLFTFKKWLRSHRKCTFFFCLFHLI